MRFVAGRGAEAERMAGSAMAKRMAALWQRAIGKILLAGAPWQSSVGKQLRAWPQRHDDIKKRVTAKPSRTFWSPSLKIVPLC